jgi:hypothetical protein
MELDRLLRSDLSYRPERDDPVTFANQVLRDEPWDVAAEIMRLLATRAIPAFRLGADWRFRRSDVEKCIQDRTVTTSEIKLPSLGRKTKHW